MLPPTRIGFNLQRRRRNSVTLSGDYLLYHQYPKHKRQQKEAEWVRAKTGLQSGTTGILFRTTYRSCPLEFATVFVSNPERHDRDTNYKQDFAGMDYSNGISH